MKRFNAKAELAKLERRRMISSNKKVLTNILMPFFVIGFSCAALVFASYSLEDTGVEQNIVEKTNSDSVIVSDKIINDDLGVSKYYYNNENTYFKFNNMMFRIVRVNGDGSIRLMLNENISRDWSISINDNLDKWFNTNFKNNSYVVNSYFDNNIYVGNEEVTDLMNLTSAVIKPVGLLSFREYKLMYIYDDNSTMFLYSIDMYNNRWCTNNGILTACKDYENYGIRPVINIKKVNMSGEGPIDNPYMIEE